MRVLDVFYTGICILFLNHVRVQAKPVSFCSLPMSFHGAVEELMKPNV